MSNDASTGGFPSPGDESLGSVSTDYDSGAGLGSSGTTDYSAGSAANFGSTDYGSSGGSTAGAAKEQAAAVGQTAKDAGSQVASTAAEQAKNVAGETKSQAQNLLSETKSQVSQQAGAQKDKASGGIRGLSDELRSLADGTSSGGSGLVTDLSREAADKLGEMARWLESREPSDLLEDIRDFARRRPGTFLVGAAVAGVFAGRLTRGAVDVKREESGSDSSSSAWSDTSNGYDAGSATLGARTVRDDFVVDTEPFGARSQSSTVGGDRL